MHRLYSLDLGITFKALFIAKTIRYYFDFEMQKKLKDLKEIQKWDPRGLVPEGKFIVSLTIYFTKVLL